MPVVGAREDASTPSDSDWFEGGDLHKKSLLDWRRADKENRLATAADIVTAAYDDTNIGNLRERAERLEGQITEVATNRNLSDKVLSRQTVTDTATAVILNGHDSLYFGTLLDWKYAGDAAKMETVLRFVQAKFPSATRGELIDLAEPKVLGMNQFLTLFESNAELETQTFGETLESLHSLVLKSLND